MIQILDKWCLASRAKFNKDKTEAVPMGTKQYREYILETRHIAEGMPTLPVDLRISPEGTSICSLRAWIRNKDNTTKLWPDRVKKVASALARWGKCNPTLHGRHLIV